MISRTDLQLLTDAWAQVVGPGCVNGLDERMLRRAAEESGLAAALVAIQGLEDYKRRNPRSRPRASWVVQRASRAAQSKGGGRGAAEAANPMPQRGAFMLTPPGTAAVDEDEDFSGGF